MSNFQSCVEKFLSRRTDDWYAEKMAQKLNRALPGIMSNPIPDHFLGTAKILHEYLINDMINDKMPFQLAAGYSMSEKEYTLAAADAISACIKK